jgi:hypothetical protein
LERIFTGSYSLPPSLVAIRSFRYGDTVLRAKALEEELAKARKHSTMLQSKLNGAFAQYHNEV